MLGISHIHSPSNCTSILSEHHGQNNNAEMPATQVFRASGFGTCFLYGVLDNGVMALAFCPEINCNEFVVVQYSNSSFSNL